MTSYKPGETFPNLKSFLKEEIEEVSRVQVPLGEPNIVCFDSEAFRYLVLLDSMQRTSRQASHGFQELGSTLQFARSWTISSEASEKIVKYSSSLPPLHVKKTLHLSQDCSLLTSSSRILDFLVHVFRKKFAIQSLGQDLECLGALAKSLLKRCARLSAVFQRNSVTIYNDQFDAQLEERINTYHGQSDDLSQALAHSLRSCRDFYREQIKSCQNLDRVSVEQEMSEIERTISLDLQVSIQQLRREIQNLFAKPEGDYFSLSDWLRSIWEQFLNIFS